jgi:hypothetical protein
MFIDTPSAEMRHHCDLTSEAGTSHTLSPLLLISSVFVRDLKVPKSEIFDRSEDFNDFYTIKPFWVNDFGAKM